MIAAALRTHCPKGHPYDEANTIVKKRGAGRAPSRDCRACANARLQESARRPIVIREDELDALKERLCSQICITDTGCWEWTGDLDRKGYGRMRWHSRTVLVHRIVAHLTHALDINDPSVLARHRCDNPPCCRPDHLLPGSHADNLADAIERGRNPSAIPRDTCSRGHAYEGDNVGIGSRGRRFCRTCMNAWGRAYYQRRKASEGAFWRAEGTKRHKPAEQPSAVTR